MKVLFITRGFPSEKDLMSGNYEAVQAKALTAKGVKVSVMSVQVKKSLFWFGRNRIRHRSSEGVEVYEVDYYWAKLRLVRKLNEYVRNLTNDALFKRVVRDQGMPDLIHAHLVGIASTYTFLKDKYHLPFVITEHWTQMNTTDVAPWLRKMALAYIKADKVICVSQALSESLMRNFNVKSIVINNMVSDLFFRSYKVKRTDHKFRFIACGAFRSNRNKGFDILVDAFAQARFPDNVELEIVGDGEDRPFVESKISEYGLKGQIHLLGIKTPEEVSGLLCMSDCFVLSSRLETFAIVVIEAMAKGLPVIATRCGGPETFLHSEHGILVDKENTEQLACAMKDMLEHCTDYNPDLIRTFCYNNFSQDIIADKIIDIYSKLTDNVS